jgi:hypothetical protein
MISLIIYLTLSHNIVDRIYHDKHFDKQDRQVHKHEVVYKYLLNIDKNPESN